MKATELQLINKAKNDVLKRLEDSYATNPYQSLHIDERTKESAYLGWMGGLALAKLVVENEFDKLTIRL